MRLVAVIAVVIGFAIGARPADACSCLGPSPVVLPAGSAPTNTHVFIWLSPSMYGPRDASPPLALRTTSMIGTKRRVEVDTRTPNAGEFRLVELVPRVSLRANTEYQVVDGANKELGRFRTTGGPARTALTWHGVASAVVERQARGGGGSCISRQPYARLAMHESAPPRTGPVIYAVWIADKQGKLDYTRPAATYTVADADELTLGSSGICNGNNFELPQDASVKLGLKIIDTAGNASPPSEVTLDVANPTIIGKPIP